MGPRVMRRPPKYVQGFIDRHGKPRYYLRRPGHKRMQLPGLPWSPIFMQAYEAAMEMAPRIEIGASRTRPRHGGGRGGLLLQLREVPGPRPGNAAYPQEHLGALSRRAWRQADSTATAQARQEHDGGQGGQAAGGQQLLEIHPSPDAALHRIRDAHRRPDPWNQERQGQDRRLSDLERRRHRGIRGRAPCWLSRPARARAAGCTPHSGAPTSSHWGASTSGTASYISASGRPENRLRSPSIPRCRQFSTRHRATTSHS
jgi:hypothetical protein